MGKGEYSSPSYSLTGGGGVHSGGGDSCDLECVVTIQNPNLSVLSGVSKGSILQVKLKTQDKQTIISVEFLGRLAGAIVPDPLPDFLRCLQKGVAYKAIVLVKDGEFVEVKIQRA
ncbi:hypothetical protein [Geothrix sp. PMB-07]|uniref:hypothetical protein n=1 Tax=Geothrix sp. PMB-07 TaxID=3068640 RepID=UPI0027412877|nr:hypothetical protein [Geothrix sp. PMB-07]WLT30927.1 hypothetical protein Q9293_14515 [Geothrix sp. PMB-07]